MDFIGDLLRVAKKKPLIADKVLIYEAHMLERNVCYELEMVVDHLVSTLAITAYIVTQLTVEDKVMYSEETLAKELAIRLKIRYFKTRTGVLYDTKETNPHKDSTP